MVAGEASGDLLASLVIPGLQSHWADVALHGIGGPKMKALGFDAWWPQEKLAVRGYVEVLRHYREITGIRKSLLHRLLENPPDVFVGVDAPDFNLDLAFALKRRGISTMQFVCPSVWAWRAERLDKIRQCVDHVLCLFPFEPPLLHRYGIDATYVGHPLAKSIPLSPDKVLARESLCVSPDQKLIALLPGSRTSEIEHMTPLFFAASKILETQYPGVSFVLPVAPGHMQLVQSLQLRLTPPQNLMLLQGQSHTALAAADATMVASGTATLEAALFKCPMVIAYHMPWLSWQIIRRKRLQPWVGLPNILCQDFIVPELLQEQATPHALAKATSEWLDNLQLVDKVKLRFTDLHKQLTQDTSGLVTAAVDKVMASHV